MRDLGAVTSVENYRSVSMPAIFKTEYAPVMELVDMRDLGSRAAMRVGSSPFRRTKRKSLPKAGSFLLADGFGNQRPPGAARRVQSFRKTQSVFSAAGSSPIITPRPSEYPSGYSDFCIKLFCSSCAETYNFWSTLPLFMKNDFLLLLRGNKCCTISDVSVQYKRAQDCQTGSNGRTIQRAKPTVKSA